MIQDIFPKHLDNHYENVQPQDMDIIFLFEGTSILGKQVKDTITYPDYGTFAQQVQERTGQEVHEQYRFIYLLSVDEQKFFLAMPKKELQKGKFIGEMADASVHTEYEAVLAGYAFIGVNAFRNAKPRELSFAAITAYHLYGWYRDNRFCGRCGGQMKHDAKERMLRCPCCDNMVFPKICPAVIVGVTDGDRILLTKYAGRAYKNYALVAGFTEIGETLEQTVEREVMEEVGLRVKNIRYYKSQPWALSGSLLAGYYCELDGDDNITLQEDELSVGTWVHADELDAEDDGVSLTREMICEFVKAHRRD